MQTPIPLWHFDIPGFSPTQPGRQKEGKDLGSSPPGAVQSRDLSDAAQMPGGEITVAFIDSVFLPRIDL